MDEHVHARVQSFILSKQSAISTRAFLLFAKVMAFLLASIKTICNTLDVLFIAYTTFQSDRYWLTYVDN